MPGGLPMKLHRTDNTMIRSSHLNTCITTEMQHTIALCGQFADTPLRQIIIYREISVIQISK